MWKIASLLVVIHLCGTFGGNVYRNGWSHVEHPQPAYHDPFNTNFGPVLSDLASFQQRLYEQGLAPLYKPQELSPPFYLTNNASPNVYQQHGQPAHHHQSPPPQPEHQGKHKCIHTVKDDKKKGKEHATIPTTHIKDIKHDNLADKVHAIKPIVNNLKETIDQTLVAAVDAVVKKPAAVVEKIPHLVETIETIKEAIPEIDVRLPHKSSHQPLVDKLFEINAAVASQVDKIPELIEAIEIPNLDLKLPVVTLHKPLVGKHQALVDKVVKIPVAAISQVEVEANKLIDRINNKLKKIQGSLTKLKLGQVADIRSLDDDSDEELEDEFEARSIDDVSVTPNVVHSVAGKRLRSLELDAELRGNLKTSISDAVKKAQEKFNKLIDDQVSKINNKIADITLKFETAFGKFQDALVKLPTPPPVKPVLVVSKATVGTTTTTEKYTTINWKPKTTTTSKPPVTKFYEKFTTPEYFKYTVPASHWKSADLAVPDLNRMDSDVDALKIVDNAKNESTKSGDDSTKAEPSVAEDAEKKIEADEAKSIEDLQSQVLETVKDTLKSEIDATAGAFEDIQSANPVDEINLDLHISSTDASVLRKESDVVDENSNADDMTKKLESIAEDGEVEEGEGEVKAGSQTSDDDLEKSPEIDDDIEMREIDDDEEETAELNEADEDSQLTQSNQAGSFRFDELEVIQLIPVIIAQLRQGHVSESEQVALREIFGDLWPLLMAEARRVEGDAMDPVLRTIIDSEEVRLAKRDITKQIGNDIFKNSVRRVYRGNEGDKSAQKPYLSLDDNRRQLSPSERLLKMVAAIVHKANAESKLRQKQKRKQIRKKTRKNPLGIVTVERPRQRIMDRVLSVNRIKRSIVKFTSDMDDMKALLEQVNEANASEDYEEEDGDDEEAVSAPDNTPNEDYYLDEEYYSDDEYPMSPSVDYMSNRLSWNQRRSLTDYEDGSVNEFIQLAKQRDRREKAHTDYLDDDNSYEDDY